MEAKLGASGCQRVSTGLRRFGIVHKGSIHRRPSPDGEGEEETKAKSSAKLGRGTLVQQGDSIIHRYLIAAVALLATGTIAHAATPDLIGTHWYATDDGCVFDEVMFAGDGTADLYDSLNDATDTVSWSLEGTSLTMAFIDENDGVIAGAVSPGRIEVVHTWQALTTKKVHQDACVLEPE